MQLGQAVCTLCWHSTSGSAAECHGKEGCGRAHQGRERPGMPGTSQVGVRKGMGCHPAQLLDPTASPRGVVRHWLLAPEPREHPRACAPGKTRWIPALGRLQVDTRTPLGTEAAPERGTDCTRRRPQPIPSQEKQQAYLGELPISKPLHPSHARDCLALGRGSVGDDNRRPPGETFDLSPDEFPNSKFLPILKAKR